MWIARLRSPVYLASRKGGPHTLLQTDGGEPGGHCSETSSLSFPSGLGSASYILAAACFHGQSC